MAKSQPQSVSSKLKKLIDELCRQSKKRQETEWENSAKIKKLLNELVQELDPGLGDLGDEFGKCCTPHLAGGWRPDFARLSKSRSR
jgi:hypothetical protein